MIFRPTLTRGYFKKESALKAKGFSTEESAAMAGYELLCIMDSHHNWVYVLEKVATK